MRSVEEVAGSQADSNKKYNYKITVKINLIINNLIHLLLNLGVVLMFKTIFFYRLYKYIYI